MNTHTPGPWFVERMYEGSRTVAILRDFKGPNVALAVHGPQDWIHATCAVEQIEANAHLIAAAPDLLSALVWAQKQLRMLVTDDDGDGAFIRGGGIELAGFGAGMEAVNAAIAKAEGR